MSDCIFCRILAGDAPASVVYRDDTVCAFMDIAPVNLGHVLVIPVAHAVGLRDLEAGDGAAMFYVGQRIANALRKTSLEVEGVNLFLADGKEAGQEVFHVHLHVLPRFVGDGFGLKLGPQHRRDPGRSALDEAATAIRSSL